MSIQLKLLSLSFFIGFNLLVSSLSAQVIQGELNFADTTQTHIITTQRGDIFVGRITEIINTAVTFQFKNKLLNFNLNELAVIEIIDSDKDMVSYAYRQNRQNKLRLKIAYPNIHGHEQMLVSPTAFNLKKGQGEYRNTEILLNMMDYGFSDHFSMGFGAFVPFLVHLRAKYTQSILPKVHLGIGSNLFISTINNTRNSPLYNHSYAVVSVGTPERFLSGSLGYFTPFSDEFRDKTSVITLGGGFRMSAQWKFILESVILPDLHPDESRFFPSINFAWFNQRNKIEFGLMAYWVSNTFFGPSRPSASLVPTVSYARRFGK